MFFETGKRAERYNSPAKQVSGYIDDPDVTCMHMIKSSTTMIVSKLQV